MGSYYEADYQMVLVIAKSVAKTMADWRQNFVQWITPNAPMDAMAELWLPAGKKGPAILLTKILMPLRSTIIPPIMPWG